MEPAIRLIQRGEMVPEIRLVCEHGHIFPWPENQKLPAMCQVIIDPASTIKEICNARIQSGQFIPASTFTHKIEFRMPGCLKHFGNHRWWCKKCDKVTEEDFRAACLELWKLQGVSEDRIVK